METFEGEVALEERSALSIALAALPALGLAALGAVGRHAYFFAYAFATALLPLFALYNQWRPRKRSARIRADAAGIHEGDALIVPRASIVQAYFQARPGAKPVVRLLGRMRAPILDVAVTSEAEGVALLRALEADVSHRTAEFLGAPPMFGTMLRQFGVGGLGVVLAMMGGFIARATHVPALTALGPIFLLLVVAIAWIPSRIVVGADGVLVSWLGTRRFYSFADVESVTPLENGVLLGMATGPDAVIYTSPHRKRSYGIASDLKLRAVRDRIDEALAAYRAGKAPVDVAALVARGGRSVRDWMDALRGLGEDMGYRRAAVPVDALWRVVEDPAAAPSARAGAAAALRSGLDEDGRARLRVAAEASASPRIRVALEAAGAEDEGALSRALEECAREDAEPARRS